MRWSCVATRQPRGKYISCLTSVSVLTISVLRSSQVVQSNAGCDINIKVSSQPVSLLHPPVGQRQLVNIRIFPP